MPPVRRLRRAHLSVALLASMAAVSLLPGAVSAAPSVTFEPVIGACNPRGQATPDLKFRLVVKSKSGAVKLDKPITTQGDGSWAAPCGEDIAIGDVFTAKKGTTVLRTFTIPRIALTIDRAGDTLVGSAPKAQTVSVVVRSCEAQSMGCEVAVDGGRDVTADGLWDWPLDGIVDIRGTDDVTVTWNGAKGDHVEATFYPPMLRAQWNSASVFVTGLKPGATAKVTLTRGGSVVASMTTTASRYGYAGGDLKRNGSKVRIKVGDVLRLKGVAEVELAIPAISVTFKPNKQDFSGTCYANSTGAVSNLAGSGDATFATAGGGGFIGSLSEQASVGDDYLLMCANPEGDVLWRTGTVS